MSDKNPTNDALSALAIGGTIFADIYKSDVAFRGEVLKGQVAKRSIARSIAKLEAESLSSDLDLKDKDDLNEDLKLLKEGENNANTPYAKSIYKRRDTLSSFTTPVRTFWHSTSFVPGYDLKGASLIVQDFDEGPVIPEQYHRALCDYAIALASVKGNPEMYGRHMEIWEGHIVNIKEQASDRELVYSIKSII